MSKFKQFIEAALGIFILVQNLHCGAPGGSGAFVLGGGPNSTTNNSNNDTNNCVTCNTNMGSLLDVSAIQAATPVMPGSLFNASAFVRSSDPNVICLWDLQNSTGSSTFASSIPGTYSSGSCLLSNIVAPSTVGTYRIKLTAQASGKGASGFTNFEVQSVIVAATGSANTAIISEIDSSNKSKFSIVSHILTSVNNTNVSIGYFSGTTKVPFQGCSFAAVQSTGTGIDVNCSNVTLPHHEIFDIWVDVAFANSSFSCPSSGALFCIGNYRIDNSGFYGCTATQNTDHPFKVDYFNNLNARLPAMTGVPGYVKTCWVGPSLNMGIPNADNNTAMFFDIPGEIAPVAGLPKTNWSAVIQTNTSINPSPVLEIWLTSDDGSKMDVRDMKTGQPLSFNTPGTGIFSQIFDNGYGTGHSPIALNRNLYTNCIYDNDGNAVSCNDVGMTIFYQQMGGGAVLKLKVQ